MTRYFNIVRKDVYTKDGQEQVKWKQTGMVLIEKEGKMYLVDERSGDKFYVFEKQARENKPSQPSKSSDSGSNNDFEDDIPF